MRLLFGNCVLDLDRRELSRNGTVVHTRSKVFAVLRYLVENRDRVVDRDEIMSACWPGLNVSDTTLSTCILSVRRAIDDSVSDSRFIKTLRGQGFRFVADVSQDDFEFDNVRGESIDPGSLRTEPLSIAVFRFANLNNDPTLDYLSEGLAEDIAGALSRFKAFTVIAASSSLQFRGPSSDMQRVAAELEATYFVEGSVRCVSNECRVTAQLVHAPTAKHIWSEVYDGILTRVFEVQDDISRRIVSSIAPHVDLEEIRRASDVRSSDPSAESMAWRARALIDRARSEGKPALYQEGMNLAEDAAEGNPNCRQAWWTIAFANYALAFGRQGANAEPLLARAREAAEKLRALDRNDHSAYMALGWVSYIEQDARTAREYLAQAHMLNPNCTMTLMLMGVIETASGSPERGYEHLDMAVRRSPQDTFLGFMLAAQAFACFALERFAEGVELSRRAIQREPHAPANHIILAACLVEIGDRSGAAAAIGVQQQLNEELLRLYMDRKRHPFSGEATSERYAHALRIAYQEASKPPPDA